LTVLLVQQAQFAQVTRPLAIDERALEDPADAAGVRADDHVRVGRQRRADGVQTIADLPAGLRLDSGRSRMT
jgi:hypothetical protein